MSCCHGWIMIRDPGQHSFLPCAAALDRDECRRSADLLSFEILLICPLHWLKIPRQINFKLAAVAYKCLPRTDTRLSRRWTPPDVQVWRSSTPVINHVIISDCLSRAFPPSVTGHFRLLLHCTSNSLPHHITSAFSVLAVGLQSMSEVLPLLTVLTMTLQCPHSDWCHFGHFKCSFIAFDWCFSLQCYCYNTLARWQEGHLACRRPAPSYHQIFSFGSPAKPGVTLEGKLNGRGTAAVIVAVIIIGA